MAFFVSALRENPELAIFLTLAAGFVIGRIRIGSFSLGNVVGTLLAGVVIGQLDIEVDPLVKVVFFDLFLFATGYKVGPQFFRGLKKNAGPQVALTIVLCVTSLVTTVTAAKIMGYDSGTAAGLMAGAFTESTVIGTAGQTHRTARSAGGRETAAAEQHPRGVRRELPGGHGLRCLVPVESRSAAAERGPEGRKPQAGGVDGCRESGPNWAASRCTGSGRFARSGSREGTPAANRSVADVERSFAPARVFIYRVRQNGVVADAAPGTTLRPGDSGGLRRPETCDAGWRRVRGGRGRGPGNCSTFRSRPWTSCSRTSALPISRSRNSRGSTAGASCC